MHKAIIFSLISCLSYTEQFGCNTKSNGTTKNIEEIFMGRCHYFLNLQQTSNCNIDPANYNCTQIWRSFRNAITNKNPCSVTIDDFDNFLSLVNHPIPDNSSVFWSGTYTPTHDLVKARQYWSLEDTFSGYLLNEMTFCSTNVSNDFSYEQCPESCVTKNAAFWNAASINFAKKASGYVKIVLNGTRTFGAISNSSTFNLHELPNLNSSKIKQLTVFLLHSPDQPKYETCSKPKTLVYLQNVLREKNIVYQCEDNPENILFLMCFYNLYSKECQAIQYLINSSPILNINIFTIIAFLVVDFFI